MLTRTSRNFSSDRFFLPRPGGSFTRRVTVLRGDGIGPEVCNAAMRGTSSFLTIAVVKASGAPVVFDTFEKHECFTPEGNEMFFNVIGKFAPEMIQSLKDNKIALKFGFVKEPDRKSDNLALRQQLGVFCNVLPVRSLEGIPGRFENIDIQVFRENCEGEYSGVEHEVVDGVVESLKVMTRSQLEKVIGYAFETSYLNGRKKITAVHKANIMKRADGLFLEIFYEYAKKYPSIKANDIIIDNCCMQLVSNPNQFDVMVTPNLYGSIVSNALAGLIGCPWVVPGVNISEDLALFEQGPRHLATDIEGKGIANPFSMIESSSLMLRHARLPYFANLIEDAMNETLKQGKVRTRDMGGDDPTAAVVSEVIKNMNVIRG